jgi:hypothetical protein
MMKTLDNIDGGLNGESDEEAADEAIRVHTSISLQRNLEVRQFSDSCGAVPWLSNMSNTMYYIVSL